MLTRSSRSETSAEPDLTEFADLGKAKGDCESGAQRVAQQRNDNYGGEGLAYHDDSEAGQDQHWLFD